MGKARKVKKKDPNAPRMPLSSYLEFAQTERPKIKDDLGLQPISEVGKELGLRWKKLDKIKKAQFEEKARENRVRYEKEMMEYQRKNSSSSTPGNVSAGSPPSLPEELYENVAVGGSGEDHDGGHSALAGGDKSIIGEESTRLGSGQSKQKKAKKDPNAPKRPLTSYLEFTRIERTKVLLELGPLPVLEVGRELGSRWRQLDLERKKVFEEKGRENRVRYEKEMVAYKNKGLPVSSSTTSMNSQDALEVAANHLSTLPSILAEASVPVQEVPPSIASGDLGFAKQKGYSFHPALKTGELARGTRIQVTYFGTGQTGTVDRAKWLKYSKQAEERITTPRLKTFAAFRSGVDQLKNLLAKIQTSKDAVTSSGITFTAQSGERRLGRLSKDGLQKEEEENIRMMKEKIVRRDGSPNKWGCRDCSWKGKFTHKAASHARICGLRRRENQRKPKQNKFECSGDNCSQSFPYLSQLHQHYK